MRRARRDIEEHHLIRALFVVAFGQLNGIAHVTEFAAFGLAELDAPRHLAVMDIKAGDDASRKHGSEKIQRPGQTENCSRGLRATGGGTRHVIESHYETILSLQRS